MLRNKQVLVLLGVAMGSAAAFAQAEPDPRLVTVTQVIEELVHPVRIFKYEPAYKLDRAAADKKGPEATVAAWIEAMRRSDYKGALGYWDASSQAQIEAQAKRDGRSEDDWKKTWQALFSTRETIATNKVLFDTAILIEYEVVDAAKKTVTSEPVVLVKEGGRWALTLKFANHAVVQGWKLPTKRVHRMNSASVLQK